MAHINICHCKGRGTSFEESLIKILKCAEKEYRAGILQTYIQRYGPLSNEAGEIVKELLKAGDSE